MIIILGGYAVIVWLLFFQFKIFPWNRLTKIAVSIVGLAILLTFMGLLNSRTPSGRVAILAPVISIAPIVSGTVAEIAVKSGEAVSDGQLLFRLDKRPFEFTLDQANANLRVAERGFIRIDTAIKKNPGTFSRQQLDEAQAVFEAATAAVNTAQYNLDRTDIVANGSGSVGVIELQVGDRLAAFSPAVPLIRENAKVIGGVFQQNGNGAVEAGAPVGIALASEPGVVHWTTIQRVSSGIASGQINFEGRLLGAGDVGGAADLLVVIDWPETLVRDTTMIGMVGSATVIGANAGPVGGLGQILLVVKSFVNYL